MAASVSVDDSLWPLLISRFEARLPDAAFAEYIQRGTRYLLREEPYVSVFDMSQATIPSALQRRLYLEWMRQYGPLMRQWVVGGAFVITSPIIRVTLSAGLHVAPLPIPFLVLPDLSRAVAWAASRLAETGQAETATRILERFRLRPPPPP